jgi:hypothetical protein
MKLELRQLLLEVFEKDSFQKAADVAGIACQIGCAKRYEALDEGS